MNVKVRWVNLGKLPSLLSVQTVKLVVLGKRRLKNSKPPTDRSVVPIAINNVMYTKQVFLNLELSL
jgi:hypothetical protein